MSKFNVNVKNQFLKSMAMIFITMTLFIFIAIVIF